MDEQAAYRKDAEAQRREEPDAELNDLSHAVIGAAIEVHRCLHAGLPETVYEEALCIELTHRQISFERQPPIDIHYRGQLVGQGRLDLWIQRKLIVELKAVEQVLPKHKAQARAYLVATGCKLALLINFHEAILKDGVTRIVQT